MAEQKIKYIVRVANTDLDGTKPTLVALCKIKGVSKSFANAVCVKTGVDRVQKLGLLEEPKVQAMSELILQPKGFPTWMFNRQKDYETGQDVHLLGGDLTFTQENDVKREKQVKSYKGMRHAWGLTVRGQRTSSNHRRTKAKKANAAKRGKKA
ncbi:MAG: 30S ribosomal protein S13 [Candidatus Woesearchaeota archaeon]